MLRYLTAGESHGKALTAIVEGIPSNLNIDKEYIDFQLRRRQLGYGRGNRMKIETDSVEILSGIRFGKTLGSPITLQIKNSDWDNWQDKMSVEPVDSKVEQISIPRPGHADLTGTIKYNYDDIRNSIERSSARETASRVAAGSVARKLLEDLDIYIGSFVESIGGVYPENNYLHTLLNNDLNMNFSAKNISTTADKSKVRVLETNQEKEIINKIKEIKKNGNTLGGTFVTVASGVPIGLGSFMQYDRRLDAGISNSFMSIQAIKGVEIGAGFSLAEKTGSESNDEIIFSNNRFDRKTNRAGGIEGGISNGLPIIVRAAMKPIATLMSPVNSIDLKSFTQVESRRERSDFVAVPACSIIAESVLALTIADFVIQKFGGDDIEELKSNLINYNSNITNKVKAKFNNR